MRSDNSKTRLDVLLTERGLAESRQQAKAIIMSGNVYVNGQKAIRAALPVSDDADINVRNGLPFVSRGGIKLSKALESFDVSPKGKICLDCGASTGGFTDCLLQNGAKLVYAVDVGYGQLVWSLRNDPRVITMERLNIRNATPDMFDVLPELCVVDLSFISLAIVLPVIKKLMTGNGIVICLIKPQFEAGRDKVGKKGVIRDKKVHKDVLDTFLDYSVKAGYSVKGLTYSPIKGPEGNIEFFGLLDISGNGKIIDTNNIVNDAHSIHM